MWEKSSSLFVLRSLPNILASFPPELFQVSKNETTLKFWEKKVRKKHEMKLIGYRLNIHRGKKEGNMHAAGIYIFTIKLVL